MIDYRPIFSHIAPREIAWVFVKQIHVQPCHSRFIPEYIRNGTVSYFEAKITFQAAVPYVLGIGIWGIGYQYKNYMAGEPAAAKEVLRL